MTLLTRGRYSLRTAATEEDVARALDLRWRAFRAGRERQEGAGGDGDRFDAACDHVLIEEKDTGVLVAAFRLMMLADGREVGQSYAAQFYDLAPLAGFAGKMIELGRFCLDPGRHDPDILRLAWGGLTARVDAAGVEMIFGCSSFSGTDAWAYGDAFTLLAQRYLAPPRLMPKVGSPEVVRFAEGAEARSFDPRKALQTLPPLLRTYLTMGGRVSDHAVVDRDLGTVHVFTALEIGRVPNARARALRLVAG